jgi:hypothetical protein
MADNTMGQRQARQQAYTPDEAPDRLKFSESQLEYIDQVTRLQAAATQDPTLNGKDAARRLHSND